jgi:putative metal binding uncharacterized protein
VHEEVARLKFEREVGHLSPAFLRTHRWKLNSAEFPVVDVTFEGTKPLRLVANCDQFPELPPSVRLLNPEGDEPVGLPGGIFHQDAHPTTGLPFLCMRGIREFHTHPGHLGETWEQYRDQDGNNLVGLLAQLSSAWRKASGNE